MKKKLIKLLKPKSALITINKIVNYDLKTEKTENGFKAYIKIEDIDYDGQGRSKAQAKELAAEKALKALFKKDVDNENLINVSAYAVYKLKKEWDDETADSPIAANTSPE